MHCHPSFDNTLSGGPNGFPLKRRPQIDGAGLTVWRIGVRNRAGAGAGATPVSVAAIRHNTVLARRVLARGSLPHLPLQPYH